MRSKWNSQIGFMLAAAGSAIGLGNIWKFPYVVGVNGGGLFVLFYALCILGIAYPTMVAEISLGKLSQKNTVDTFDILDPTPSQQSPWRAGGIMAVIACILIISFYSVVGGWILFYFKEFLAHIWATTKLPPVTDGLFSQILNSPSTSVSYQLVFMTITAGIVIFGVNNGIGRLNKVLIPALVMLLIGLLWHVSSFAGFPKALDFLFSFNAEAFSPKGMLEAVGHSFFTVSVGVGIMVTYGSYLPKKASVKVISAVICLTDTIIALASGTIIFTIVFTFEGDVGQGPTLMFETLPKLFAQIPGGLPVGITFFAILTFTALTSAVSLLEVPVSYLMDAGDSRPQALAKTVTLATAIGVSCALSFNLLQDTTLFGLTLFDLADQLTSKILLPVSGLCCLLFFSYVLNRELRSSTCFRHPFPRFLMTIASRVIAPFAIVTILVFGLLQ